MQDRLGEERLLRFFVQNRRLRLEPTLGVERVLFILFFLFLILVLVFVLLLAVCVHCYFLIAGRRGSTVPHIEEKKCVKKN